jgi:hypothetical protein
MKNRATAFGVMCIAGWAVSSATAQITLEKVISNTDAVPNVAGASWAFSFAFSGGGTVDQNGNVAIRGSLMSGVGGVTSTNNSMALYGVPGNLQYVSRLGDQAPGLPAGVIQTGFVSGTPLSGNGMLWSGGSCTSPSGFLSVGPVGSPQNVARRNDAMPGGDVLSGDPSSGGGNVNSSGEVVFIGTINSTSTSAAYVGGAGALQLVCKGGVPYAGLPASDSLASVNNVYLNGQGNVSCHAFMTQSGSVTSANDEVIFTRAFGAADGTFNLVAREGDAAPGCGGATYLHDTNTVLHEFSGNYNNQNHAVFSASLEGAGVTASNNIAVWSNDGSASALFRRKGDPTAAVAGATHAFGGGVNEPNRMRLNNRDEVVWNAALTQGVGGVTAANDNTIIRTVLGSSTDTLLAREGSQVRDPATNNVIVPGALYGDFSSLQQNNTGQVVFIATLADDPNDPTNNVVSGVNDQALMAWDPVRGLMLVYRKGDSLSSIGINFVPTNIFTASSAINAANAEGGSNMLSDTGWLVFGVSTTLSGENSAIIRTRISAPCYANCDASTAAPVLNVADFTCFLQKFAAGDPYANCDASTVAPTLNVADFTCFLQKFAAGCP